MRPIMQKKLLYMHKATKRIKESCEYPLAWPFTWDTPVNGYQIYRIPYSTALAFCLFDAVSPVSVKKASSEYIQYIFGSITTLLALSLFFRFLEYVLLKKINSIQELNDEELLISNIINGDDIDYARLFLEIDASTLLKLANNMYFKSSTAHSNNLLNLSNFDHISNNFCKAKLNELSFVSIDNMKKIISTKHVCLSLKSMLPNDVCLKISEFFNGDLKNFAFVNDTIKQRIKQRMVYNYNFPYNNIPLNTIRFIGIPPPPPSVESRPEPLIRQFLLNHKYMAEKYDTEADDIINKCNSIIGRSLNFTNG